MSEILSPASGRFWGESLSQELLETCFSYRSARQRLTAVYQGDLKDELTRLREWSALRLRSRLDYLEGWPPGGTDFIERSDSIVVEAALEGLRLLREDNGDEAKAIDSVGLLTWICAIIAEICTRVSL